MSTRTQHSIVHFSSPFTLRGVQEIQPPGDYAVDEDQEQIDGNSRLAWRRVTTYIHLPAISLRGRSGQLVAIDRSELEAALELDREKANQPSMPADGAE